jgi:hypothetical protein
MYQDSPERHATSASMIAIGLSRDLTAHRSTSETVRYRSGGRKVARQFRTNRLILFVEDSGTARWTLRQ